MVTAAWLKKTDLFSGLEESQTQCHPIPFLCRILSLRGKRSFTRGMKPIASIS